MRRPFIIWLVLAAVGLTAGFTLRARYSDRFPVALREQVEAMLRAEYHDIDEEAKALLSDSLKLQSPAWDKAGHSFVYANETGIVAWNRNQYLPDASPWIGPAAISFLSTQRGDFLLKKWPWGGGYLVNILTLRDRYFITNGFLFPQINPSVIPMRDAEVVAPGASVGDAVNLGDDVLFRIVSGPREVRDSSWSIGFLLFGILFLLMALRDLGLWMARRFGPDFALLLWLVSLYFLRWAMVRTGIPSVYLQADIFDPKVFASSTLNASMGDLLFNGLCVFILVLYLLRHFSTMRLVRWLLHQHMVVRFVAGAVCLLLAFFGLLFSFNFIEVIYHNSTLSLDITQTLSLNWVRVTAFMAVLVGTVSSFLFIHVLVSLVRHLLAKQVVYFFLALGLAAGLFVIQFILSGNDNTISLATGLILLPLLRLLNFDKLDFAFSFRFFLYLIFSLTVFSIHHSLAIRGFHLERLNRDQFRYAKDFLTERDVLGEYLLDQARTRIQQDPFIRTRMASPFFSRNSVVDKIKRVHLNRYFDRYELTISTRNTSDTTSGMPLSGGSFRPTGYAGIWYSSGGEGEALKRYIVSVPIIHQRHVGYVELDLALKRVLPNNVFPELLVDNRFSQLYRNRDFSYAIFHFGHLVNRFGDFNFEKDFHRESLADPQLYLSGIKGHGYVHIGSEESEGTVAVVSAPDYAYSSVITNVSFWFVLGLALLLVVQGLLGTIAFAAGRPFAYTARIQLFMFLAFALPMVTVSITTLTLMGRSSEESTTSEFLDRSVSASQRISALFSSDASLDDARLETWISENAAYAQTDISVYSPSGSLLATSQPALFENQLLSSRINREAMRRIVLDGERQVVTSEQIGALQYSNAYAAVLSPQTGQLAAVVSLPFFESATYLQRGQILILSNILQVFVMVFLVFTLLSFLAADNLALPIRFITKKLRQTTFSGENKPLEWSTRDEIGLLVNEYNRMVQNLEESKRALARSEKESAWREMAKQVAHEIKNPLTPMKLTLQQMEQSLRTGDWNNDKSRKSVDVLLRQVEILNAIASSFSLFARMPAPSPQRLDLVNLLSETTSLFVSNVDAEVSFVGPPGPCWVYVDPTSLGRSLSNILINATQAGAVDRKLNISVTVTPMGEKVVIAIRDNGIGIPLHHQERIFQPQFTTKENGSGLGLTMARQIVSQAGGRIWFESTPGEGTTFFLELPLAN